MSRSVGAGSFFAWAGASGWLAGMIVAMVCSVGVSPSAGAADFAVYVSNERSGDVSVIDPDAHTVVATWPVGARPRGIHVTRDGRRLLVAVSGSPRLGPGADPDRARQTKPDKAQDGIAIVDTATGRVLRKLSVGSDPEQFVLTRDERGVIVANEDEGTASAWEINSGRRIFAARVSEEPEGVALHPQRPEVYVTCEEQGVVFVLDENTGAERGRFTVRGRPRSVAFSVDGARAFVPAEGDAEVTVVDTATLTTVRRVRIPGQDMLPMAAITSPEGHRIYVSLGRGNAVAELEAGSGELGAVIKVGERPWGIALSPDGRVLLSANGRSDDVSFVDTTARREVARVRVGSGPWGVAIGPPR